VRLKVDASKQPEGDHRPLTSFEGEVRGDKIYWFNRDQPQNFGQFSKEGNRLYLGGQLLKPMEQRPTLFMGTDPDSSFDLPTRHELTPLTPDQLAIIRNILNPYWLNKIFAKFHNDRNGDAVGDLLRRFLNDPPCWMKHPSVRASCEPRLEQFYEVDLPLVRQYVQLVLTAQIWKNNRNTTLSHIQWIQRMLDVTMGKAPDSAVYQLYKYTGLKRSKSAGTGQYRYEFDFTLNGLSVLLAGYTGTLTVSKKTGPKPWTKQYSIELWGGNVSIGLVDVKLHSSFKGAAQSDIEWTENDIPGPVRLARASASIGMDTASAQIGFMHLFGNESIPMLPVFFQDASLGYPNVFKILEEKSKTSIDMDPSAKFTVKGVVGLDVGVSVLFGAISPLGDALQRITLRKGGYDPVDLSLMPKWDVSTTHNLSAEVHFCFDTDTPTEAARQAIRIMCARELAQLMSPASTLAVVGHADTIGRAEYNKNLSERRARKTVDAIKEILGSKFQIPEANIKMEGKGEDFAAQESKGQMVAAPKHRRVQVFLNAKLVLTLYSQAKQPSLGAAATSTAEAEWLEPPITEAEWSEGEDLDAGWFEAISGENPEAEELETFEEFDALEDSNGTETQQSDGTPAYEAPEDEWLEMRAMESEVVTAAKPVPIQARILWPALGFPAVVSHSERPSATPGSGDATTCICMLVATSSPRLSSADAARCLRYVPWAQRGRRHIAAHAFEPGDIAVRSDAGTTALTLAGRNDRFGGHVAFGANAAKQHGIVALLAESVRAFYKNVGLPHLYEIRVSEAATARLRQGQYHLFWNNLHASEDAPSDEMKLLVERFARPRRAKLGKAWDSQRDFLLAEYMYEYGGLHAPYNRTRTRARAEILHPLFIRARSSAPLTIGHVTDTHVDVRADVYEHNLEAARIAEGRRTVDYNNFNTSFVKIYGEARQTSDILLMTGDLIDYGRGFWGLGRALEVQQDGLYHTDRNWFLFYDLIAAGDAYSTPTYTILGNHDWRLNPYPPFAPGAPNPNELINNHMGLTRAQQHDVIAAAHGDGHKRGFSYSVEAEKGYELLRQLPLGDTVTALVQLFGRTGPAEQRGFPTETSFESIAWYLLSINPFLDYSFTLPGKQSVLMLDWAKDELVLFPIVKNGEASGYDPLTASDAAGTPRPRYSPTPLQQQMLAEFVSGPSRSKIVGVHAPPISPYSDWHTADLVAGRKTYSDPDTARGPKDGHPLFAVTPSTHVMTPSGMVADRGSLGNNKGRDWFIRIVNDPKYFVRLVLSGHVHRNGIYVVKRPTKPIEIVHPKDPSRRLRVDNALLVGTPSQKHQGPLYITTTSAGPRGSFEKRPFTQKEREHGGTTTDPGFTRLSIETDGKVTAMLFRGGQAPAEKAPQPKPAQREMAVGI
jgi:outer membrane protein OmpA-like peptidoglycan-associated protein/3',5'-cyclic AMP phosphodiesterase CpdA